MALSDRIEAFINELLKEESEDWLEIKRNELASVFNCVPSQINYVISTRFTPKQGYMVISKRGGGGCLKIKRLDTESLAHRIFNSIEAELDLRSAKEYIARLQSSQIISELSAELMAAAVSDSSIRSGSRDEIRADIFKNMLIVIEGGN